MAVDPQLDYRSAVPNAKRARSPYVSWVWTAVLLAVAISSAATGHAPPTVAYSIVLALIALLLFALSFATIRDIRRRGRSGVVAVIFGIATAFLLGMLFIASLSWPDRRERSYVVACASNLRQIGVAAEQYRLSNGYWPGSLDELAPLLQTTQILQCPFGKSARPYYYIRPAVGDPVPEVVVGFEIASHRDQMNILLSDGRVESVQADVALRVLAELAAGQNPPPSLRLNPATQPSTNPR